MIRPAKPKDASAIAAIWNPIIRDSTITFTTEEKSPQDITRLIETAPVWVTDDRTGFALYTPFRAGPGYAHTQEHSIHLAPGARGQGLGRQLMDTVITHARAAGHHSLIAGISGENTGAIAFHAKLGFANVGKIAQAGWKFDRWHDLHMMQKFL